MWLRKLITKRDANMKFVFDNDLEKYLRSLGVLEDIGSGRTTCRYCGDVISKNNLMAIVPEGSDIKFVCNKPSCVQKVEYVV